MTSNPTVAVLGGVAVWFLAIMLITFLRVNFGSEESMKKDALVGAAYSARMFGDNPDLSEDAVRAYRWAEAEFNRIARGEVDESDLIG